LAVMDTPQKVWEDVFSVGLHQTLKGWVSAGGVLSKSGGDGQCSSRAVRVVVLVTGESVFNGPHTCLALLERSKERWPPTLGRNLDTTAKDHCEMSPRKLTASGIFLKARGAASDEDQMMPVSKV
jgi:hypothetical protein